MTTGQIILVFAGLLIVGFIRQANTLRKICNQQELASEFLSKFSEWFSGDAKDHSLYNWMLDKSELMQATLGASGFSGMKMPFENGYHSHYAIVLNAIPDIQRMFGDTLFNGGDNHRTMIQLLDGCLRRFIGPRKEELKQERINIINPIVWFCEGLALLLELPLYILKESRAISTSRQIAIAASPIFGIFKGITALASLAAAIMVIVMGWDKFTSIITAWIK